MLLPKLFHAAPARLLAQDIQVAGSARVPRTRLRLQAERWRWFQSFPLRRPCWLEQWLAKMVFFKGPDVDEGDQHARNRRLRDSELSKTREESGIVATAKAIVLGGLISTSFWLFTSFLF